MEHFEGVGDVGLGLALEEAFVPALSKTRRRVHNELGKRGKRNSSVTGEIVAVRSTAFCARIGGPDLQVDQVLFPSVMTGHSGERFPIDAFLVNAETAPPWFVLKYLMRELVDARTRLARTGIAGNEPPTAELVALPDQAAKTSNSIGPFAGNQKPHRDQYENDTGRHE